MTNGALYLFFGNNEVLNHKRVFEESIRLGGTGHRFWSAVVFIEIVTPKVLSRSNQFWDGEKIKGEVSFNRESEF